MLDREIRNIQFAKGATFTTKFIRDFEREWNQVTRAIRRSSLVETENKYNTCLKTNIKHNSKG